MKGKILRKLKEVVDNHNDDYDELIMELYSEVVISDSEDPDIVVMNLVISGIIRKFEGFKIIGD